MFPPEIFTEIFSFLTSEARALVACSQAHPIFAQLVEPTLYAHVVIHDHDVDDVDGHHLWFKPHQLTALLSDNPRILNYLRSLGVDLSTSHSDGVMKEIISILPRLKLERIQLTAITCSHTFVDWLEIPMALRTAFVACFSTSNMVEICVNNIRYFPLSTFADCAGLKHLTLWYKTVPPLNSSFKFPHLETLELLDWSMNDRPHDFFSWALTHACGLRSLTFTTSLTYVIHGFLPRLLAICSTSLVNLTIRYNNYSKSIYSVSRIALTPPYYSICNV